VGGYRVARVVAALSLAVALSAIASSAYAFPETAYPGRSEFGDGCWGSNCHGPNNTDGTGPHGNYSNTSNICGICHTLHDAASDSYKLLPRSTVTDTCFFCHDGTAASGKGVYGAIAGRGLTVQASHSCTTTNIVPGGAADGGSATMAFSEGGMLGCGDCHSPHGRNTVNRYRSNRARNSVNDTFRNPPLLSSKLLRSRPGGVATATMDYGSDWCLACHQGRGSGGSMVVNHPVDSTATIVGPFTYSRVAMMASDTSLETTIGSMGRLVTIAEFRVRHNRAFVMPYPRTVQQAGHAPICQQCHENARAVGAVGAVEPSPVGLDGTNAAANPRFNTFPHESTNASFLVEVDDDLCMNCHPADQLP
jgi:hypothetical protein